MYDEYEDGEGGGTSLGRKLALGIGVIAIAAAGFFAFQALTKDDGGGEAVTPADGTASVDGTDAQGADVSGADGSDVTSADDEDGSDTTTQTDETSGGSGRSTSQDEPRASTPTTDRVSTPPAQQPTATPPPATASVTYPTRQDGSPEWVTVIYDDDSVTLKGVVPDEAARTQLVTLATQYAKDEQRATVNDAVTLNPAMPRDVGVRVVELTSTRFPPGSDEVVMEQAAEINRLVAAMQALPNTTALIVGHADQVGDEVANYVLSRNRADAVLAYMVSQGIAAERLIATAVGEEELLSLDDDEAALALNRRTEFVLFDLLMP